MNLDDLKGLLRKGESDRVELKRSTGQRTAAAKTVCAMLNGLGGFVIFGVSDKGQIVGQQVTARTLEELANELRKIEPTPEKLTQPHESKPWNPIIANVFYRAGIIERWGSGTLNILDWCKENGNPPPVWKEQAGSVYVLFRPPVLEEDQVGTKLGPSRDQVEILRNCLTEKASTELMAIVGRTNRTKFRHQVLNSLLEARLIEMTVPDKPRSSKQRYRITEKGRSFLRETAGGGNEE